ncbi:ubiquinol oxidase subunit II [Burkholderia pseudomallei]|nr:ubiquinol oxidase subunit II [Burkholderia pseudomallei]
MLDPKGAVGAAEKSLIATSTWAMLIVVVPVILLTLLFAWRYRASNRNATYAPKWAHSTAIEIVIWTVPSLIILFLGILTWKTTHALDPYRPPVPVGTPINFRITSDSVMNSFFIPQLGTQVYAMAGMQTRLHLIADEPGDFAGISANYSGRGFSDMKFRTLATSRDAFDAWVAKVRASADRLDMTAYGQLAQPSEKQPVRYYSTVDPRLFNNIIAKYNDGHVLDLKDAACRTKG